MTNLNEQLKAGDIVSLSSMAENPVLNAPAMYIGSYDDRESRKYVFMPLLEKKQVSEEYIAEVAGIQSFTNTTLYGMGNWTVSVFTDDISKLINCRYGSLSRQDITSCMRAFGTYCLDVQAFMDWKDMNQDVLDLCKKDPQYQKQLLVSSTRLMQNQRGNEFMEFHNDIARIAKGKECEK